MPLPWKKALEKLESLMEIQLEKPKGYVIVNFLEKLQGLMERDHGSAKVQEKTEEIVAERVQEEAKVLREEGEVEDRMITESFRVLRLMEMDLSMVMAAIKEEMLERNYKAFLSISLHRLLAIRELR
uniref:Uncharacterized protein n=1 Tax=Nelumbo nucifera TaxID=4432 RepID=A0A822XVM5_NELNU|nr:TPA_asm: hypothetical protein HUJ06_025854 [Nelumbo nucifera]